MWRKALAVGLGLWAGLTAAPAAALSGSAPWSVTQLQPERSACTVKAAPADAEISRYIEDYSRSSPHAAQTIGGTRIERESVVLLDALEALVGPVERVEAAGCNRAACVAERIFGEGRGLRLLYLFVRYGYNGSHLTNPGTLAWSRAQLDEVLSVLADLPPALAMRARQQASPFVYAPLTQPTVGANALSVIGLADYGVRMGTTWSGLPAHQRRASVFHEVAHNIHASLRAEERGFDWSAVAPRGSAQVSRYAAHNEREDFAEAVAAYRYNPLHLKTRSPERYAALKSVFGVEYTGDCVQSVRSAATQALLIAPANATKLLSTCGSGILTYYADRRATRRIASPLTTCLSRSSGPAAVEGDAAEQVLVELRGLFQRAMSIYLTSEDGAAADHCSPTLAISRFFREAGADQLFGVEGFSFRQNVKLAFVARQICGAMAGQPSELALQTAIEKVLA